MKAEISRELHGREKQPKLRPSIRQRKKNKKQKKARSSAKNASFLFVTEERELRGRVPQKKKGETVASAPSRYFLFRRARNAETRSFTSTRRRRSRFASVRLGCLKLRFCALAFSFAFRRRKSQTRRGRAAAAAAFRTRIVRGRLFLQPRGSDETEVTATAEERRRSK